MDKGTHNATQDLITSAAQALGIEDYIELQWSTRARRRLGLAKPKHMNGGVYAIVISTRPWELLSLDERQELICHEVAHIACFAFGQGHDGHGRYWRHYMRRLGYAHADRCYRGQSLDALPVRRNSKTVYEAVCRCRTWELSAVRRNRMVKGKASYGCPHCKTRLELTGKYDVR